MSKSSTLIELNSVYKTYFLGTQKVKALKNINFSIMHGDFIAIAGPSGSGKSSLLNLISMIDEPTNGEILYGDVKIKDLTDNQITSFRNKKIGIVFQNYNLIPVLNAVENVAFPLQINKVSKKESIERASNLLEEVGLGEHLNHRPNNLSGGQKQRVAIARALITNPEIVIADEPTAALDSKTGMDIINLMKHLNETKKTTFIFSSHDPKVIDNVDSVITLRDGEIIQAENAVLKSKEEVINS
ncbi:ABC transporter ATP-binding protein [Flavivirga jejuensis]|uniref:ABC transporter ATP-binding protein n=1 Tax=Flavivirga jejuensis TaxID=870487 RepID=A0ABT8WMM8_9FLAO|nr:ABC transporter ATP-binding protein [Flavivirga jejuensis]MDO5974415.1 ABC transporter ATP-binding protein [Flavivirga jejuensis]